MWGIDMLFQGGVSLIIFILFVQNSDLKKLTFSEIVVHKTLYVFIHVRDCPQALQVIQVFKPDCFIIEENLPTTSGLEFAASLHAQPRMRHMPTIILDADCPLVAQEKKTSSPDETIPTIAHLEILVTIVDKMLLLPEWISLNAFSMN
jgi:CheY-like chemotaxis protein